MNMHSHESKRADFSGHWLCHGWLCHGDGSRLRL
jgi:hypothetical protein